MTWDTPNSIVLQQFNWKPLSHGHLYNTSVFINKILNKHVYTIFGKVKIMSSYLRPKSDFQKRGLSYRGAIIWNSLDDKVTNLPSLFAFNMLKDVSLLLIYFSSLYGSVSFLW